MFTLRQGIFEVKGQLKSFDPLPEGVRLNFVDGQFIEVPGVSMGLLKVMTTLGLPKIQNSTVDAVMGKVFLNEERVQKLEKDKRDQIKRIKTLSRKVSEAKSEKTVDIQQKTNEDNSTTQSK